MPAPRITGLYIWDFTASRPLALPPFVPGVTLKPETLPAGWTIGADVLGTFTNVLFHLTDAAGVALIKPDPNRGNKPPLLTREPLILPPGAYTLAVTAFGGPWDKNPSPTMTVPFTVAEPVPAPPLVTPVTNLIVVAGEMAPACVHASAVPWAEQFPEAERTQHDYVFSCPTATGRQTLTGWNAAFRLDTPGEHVVTLTIQDVLTGANAVRYSQSVTLKPDTRTVIDFPDGGGSIVRDNVTLRLAGPYVTPGKGWSIKGRNVVVRAEADASIDWTGANNGKHFAIWGDNFVFDANGHTVTMTSSGGWGVNLFEPYRRNFAVFGVTGLRIESFAITADTQCVGLWMDHCAQPLKDDGMRGYFIYTYGAADERCIVLTDNTATNSSAGSVTRFSRGREVLECGNHFTDLDRRPYANHLPDGKPDPSDQRTWDFANGACRFHCAAYMWAEDNDFGTDLGSTNRQGGRLLFAPNNSKDRFTFGVGRNNRVQTEIRIGAGASFVRLENNKSAEVSIEGADVGAGKPAPVTVRLHGNAGRVWNGGAVDVQDY
jgi:hypothetical protein